MAYTTDLNNIDPSTQMPSSGEHSALEAVNQGEAQQSKPSGGDHARLEVDETLPAVQMPSSEDDRARPTLVATNSAVTLQSSESGGPFLMARTEDVRQELEKLGVLSDLQIDKVIQGLVKSASYRTSVINKAFNMFSALKRNTSNPTAHLDPRAEDIVKDKFTTPPPREVTMPSAPRPTKSAVPRRRMAPSSKPVSDLAVRVDSLENTIHGLNAIIQYIIKHRRSQPPSTLTQQPNPQPQPQPQPQMSSATPRPSSSSRFLSLPGELRNRIYRFALTGPRTIEIDKTRWSTHQPALLKTCKTIRAEALRLFYIENKISTNIHDWDPIVKYRFQQLMTSHNIRPQQLHHYFTGVPNYQNLYQWLQAVHQGRIGAISDAVGKPRPIERKIVGVMFKIVRKATGVSAWSQVEDLLVAHRELLGVGDARWMVDPEEDKGEEGDAEDKDAATE